MADTKTSDLTASTSPASTDLAYAVVSSNSRQVTLSNLSKGIVVTNLDVTGLTASQVLRVNSGGTAVESAGVTLSGADATVITGTAGTSGDLGQWNADGDLVDGPTPPTGTIVGTTDIQTLTNKDVSSTTNTFAAASLTASGVVELATIAETDTGTDATRAVTPDGLQGSLRNLRFMLFVLIDDATDVAADTSIKGDFTLPFPGTFIQDDSNPDYFAAYTDTAGSTGTMVVDVHLNGTTIMTTNKLDIETGEKDTTTAATQPDLTTTTFSAGDILTFDIDAIHSGTAAKGLKTLIAVRPD